jgi:nucleotide-binding universal stress UspA family protein
MCNHILIPTDGSELSSMAIYEGVALAKALGARVTVVTVTTPFRVFTADPRTLLINTRNTWPLSRVNIWT